jgi:hypothetical protein
MRKLTLEDNLIKFKEVHKDLYIYDIKRILEYFKGDITKLKTSIKIPIQCRTHGEFKQTPKKHKKGQGCPTCVDKNQDIETFITKAQKTHGLTYGYTYSIYTGSKEILIIECKIHGNFDMIPNSHLSGQGCPKCGIISRTKKRSMKNEKFIERATKLWKGKNDYSTTKYKNGIEKIQFHCTIHPELTITQIAANHLKKHEACSYCQDYRKTYEIATLKYLRKELPKIEFIHNTSTGNTCTDSGGHRFPDIRIDCGFYQIIIEVDEYQHRGATYECDQQRMVDIMGQLWSRCIFIRYNPNHKDSDLDILVSEVTDYLSVDINDKKSYPWDKDGLCILWMYYNDE